MTSAELNNSTTANQPKPYRLRFSLRALLVVLSLVAIMLGVYVAWGVLGLAIVSFFAGLGLVVAGVYGRGSIGAGAGICVLSLGVGVYTWIAWQIFGVGPIYSPKFWPPRLQQMHALTAGSSRMVRVEGRGAFIDSEHVWRIQATAEEAKRIVQKYRLVSVPSAKVPKEFWQVFPRAWQPTPHEKCQFWSSSNFPATSRGPDGEFDFLMHDPEANLLYVWHKFNF